MPKTDNIPPSAADLDVQQPLLADVDAANHAALEAAGVDPIKATREDYEQYIANVE